MISLDSNSKFCPKSGALSDPGSKGTWHSRVQGQFSISALCCSATSGSPQQELKPSFCMVGEQQGMSSHELDSAKIGWANARSSTMSQDIVALALITFVYNTLNLLKFPL